MQGHQAPAAPVSQMVLEQARLPHGAQTFSSRKTQVIWSAPIGPTMTGFPFLKSSLTDIYFMYYIDHSFKV